MSKLTVIVALLAGTFFVANAQAQTLYRNHYGTAVVNPGSYHYHTPHRYYPGHNGATISHNRISGYNHQTGGWNSSNHQIHDSVHNPYRESSKYNGSRRWVRKPVYNQYGQRVGYSEGWTWRNSVTGQIHKDVNNYTPNRHGGVHQNRQRTSAITTGS